jgi:hypothetical protein
MTSEETRQYQLGGEMMRERLIALIHHYYETLKKYHGHNDDRCALLRNIVEDIRIDQAESSEKESESTHE